MDFVDECGMEHCCACIICLGQRIRSPCRPSPPPPPPPPTPRGGLAWKTAILQNLKGRLRLGTSFKGPSASWAAQLPTSVQPPPVMPADS